MSARAVIRLTLAIMTRTRVDPINALLDAIFLIRSSPPKGATPQRP